MDELNEQRQQRIKKADELRAAGVAPYGGRFEVKDRAGQLIKLHGEKSKEVLEQEQIRVTFAGRVVALRRFGKAGFAVLQDGSDRLQVYLKKDLLTEQAYKVTEQLDLGDWIGVTGTLFRPKTNEFTVEVRELTFLSKALRPLPEKWHGLTDVETRYRQRYVDLIANPEVHGIFATRSRIIAGIRSYLIERGFLEVETPMMHPIPGGAAAKPFVTHHNALGVDLYLRIAPELFLKRLLVAGFETTIGLIGNGVAALARHPAEQAKLRARPELVPNAVEECLRFEGPIGMTLRVLHEDAAFGGRTIPCDTEVWAMLWGANRDPAVFADPDRFDVERPNARDHLAFGGGAHLCLGAHLARMEGQVAIGTLVARTKEFALVSDRVAWGASLFRVPARLPIEFAAA